ncbi:MAG: hypothetical protein JOZ32_19745 [Bryobacterales bacterium]|nr:hypothetical protein [Bryobacterales bacterium]
MKELKRRTPGFFYDTGIAAPLSRVTGVTGNMDAEGQAMDHCGGGFATLDTFDMPTASVTWFEMEQSPESLTAPRPAFHGRAACSVPI